LNLKQISLAMALWSVDHGTNFPMQVSWTNGGSKELTLRGWVAPSLRAISNELQNSKVTVCPEDKERLPAAAAFNSMTDRQISYFLHLGATVDRSDAVLLGDRNVATNRVGLRAGMAEIQDVETVSWTTAIHEGEGNVALADGSAHRVPSKGFQNLLKTTMIVTNALVIP
jgi:hypothetical protein